MIDYNNIINMAAYRESTRGEEYQIESLKCACHDCSKR
jgi:hypothetical protein